MAASTPILCSRAGGNPVKTHKCILTISLLRRGARLFDRRILRSGRAGPTSRGREMLTHFNYQPLPPFFVRAPGEILSKRTSAF